MRRKALRSRELLPPHRHHLQRLWRGRRRRAADPVRHGAAHHHRRRMAPAVARDRAAGARAQRLHARPLSPAGDHPLGPPARTAVPRQRAWLPQMVGFTPPGGVYTHIVGIDLVRTGPDEFIVLEDNARTPSGVSYMLENRETMMAMFPELFSKVQVQRVSDYPRRLAKSLAACAPNGAGDKPERRRADAGHLQFGLFRTRLPRRPDGRGAGRRQRSARGRRTRADAHHRRASSRSTCSIAGSTTNSSIR